MCFLQKIKENEQITFDSLICATTHWNALNLCKQKQLFTLILIYIVTEWLRYVLLFFFYYSDLYLNRISRQHRAFTHKKKLSEKPNEYIIKQCVRFFFLSSFIMITKENSQFEYRGTQRIISVFMYYKKHWYIDERKMNIE